MKEKASQVPIYTSICMSIYCCTQTPSSTLLMHSPNQYNCNIEHLIHLQNLSRKAGFSILKGLSATDRIRNRNASNTVLQKRQMAEEQSEKAQGTWQGRWTFWFDEISCWQQQKIQRSWGQCSHVEGGKKKHAWWHTFQFCQAGPSVNSLPKPFQHKHI